MPPTNDESFDQKKKRVCVTLWTNGDGSDRLSPYFTGNGTPPQSLSKNLTTKDCVWRSNNIAWISVDLMREWVLRFSRHIGNQRVLLLMDDFWVHRVGVYLSNLPANIHIEFLLLREIGLFQPLQQGIIHEMKENFVKNVLNKQFRMYSGRESFETLLNHDVIQTGRKTAALWVQDAWMKGVKSETIEDCFRKTVFYDENCSLEMFIAPDTPQELLTLYLAVLEAGRIENALDFRDFLYPDLEDELPFSTFPTVFELIQCHLPVSESDDFNESDDEDQHERDCGNTQEQAPDLSRIQSLNLNLNLNLDSKRKLEIVMSLNLKMKINLN